MNWINANKLATVFSILGGIYLIFQLYASFFSLKSKFNSEIWIQEINQPKNLKSYSFRADIEQLIPEGYNKYQISQAIIDTISNQLDSVPFSIYDQILNTIPEDFRRYHVASNIDSLFSEILYPVKAAYYSEVSIKNTGSKTATNIRFEIPVVGYFELFENEVLHNSGRFSNIIAMPDLRPSNQMVVRIWSYDYLSNYHVKRTEEVRFTFDNGVIIPKTKEVVISEGILYWIFSNPWFSLYIVLMVVIWFPRKNLSKQTKKTNANNG